MHLTLTGATLSLALAVAGPAIAAPPTLSPSGKLEPVGACKRFMDFRRSTGGSVADGIAERITTSTYNRRGQLIAERWWGFDTPVRLVRHRYNKRGQRVRTTWRLTNQRLVLTKQYRYDARGNLRSKTTTYAKSKQRWRDDYRYDAAGRLVRLRTGVNLRTGRVTGKTHRYIYKGSQLVAEHIDLDHDGKPDQRMRYGYDARGHLITRTMSPSKKGYARQHTILTYNKKGQLTELEIEHRWPKRPQYSGPRRVESYQYDRAGNLIGIERRVLPGGPVGLHVVFDYSCHGAAKPRRLPASRCTYRTCGKP